jgi:hypothetical protein
MKRVVAVVAGLVPIAFAISAQHVPPLDRDNPAKSRTVLRDQLLYDRAKKHSVEFRRATHHL